MVPTTVSPVPNFAFGPRDFHHGSLSETPRSPLHLPTHPKDVRPSTPVEPLFSPVGTWAVRYPRRHTGRTKTGSPSHDVFYSDLLVQSWSSVAGPVVRLPGSTQRTISDSGTRQFLRRPQCESPSPSVSFSSTYKVARVKYLHLLLRSPLSFDEVRYVGPPPVRSRRSPSHPG